MRDLVRAQDKRIVQLLKTVSDLHQRLDVDEARRAHAARFGRHDPQVACAEERAAREDAGAAERAAEGHVQLHGREATGGEAADGDVGGADVRQARQRHRQIEEFQARQQRPKAMVATLKIGNCGITLTAATRVYLMEPFLNPAHEAQAAGRIHRLGQSREVLVKRFCFSGSFDEAVAELHGRIKSGQVALVDGRLPAAEANRLRNK